jgi:pseudouridine-5'-phosphate glycosidase
MAARDALGQQAGILVANPLPVAEQLDPAVHDRALTDALRMADEQGLTGKEVTPFLLLTIVELTGGESLAVNLKIAENNIRVAGEIALSWSGR